MFPPVRSGRVSCTAAVVCGYVKADEAWTSLRFNAVLKRKYRPMFLTTISPVFIKHGEVCNEEVNNFRISSL